MQTGVINASSTGRRLFFDARCFEGTAHFVTICSRVLAISSAVPVWKRETSWLDPRVSRLRKQAQRARFFAAGSLEELTVFQRTDDSSSPHPVAQDEASGFGTDRSGAGPRSRMAGAREGGRVSAACAAG